MLNEKEDLKRMLFYYEIFANLKKELHRMMGKNGYDKKDVLI